MQTTTNTVVPVWMEQWNPTGAFIIVPDANREGFFGTTYALGGSDPFPTDRDQERAKLAAAAPACARALLGVEWSSSGMENHAQCPDCGGFRPSSVTTNDRPYYANRADHRQACALDTALTEAGLPTQAKRDEARRLLATARASAPMFDKQ